MDRIVSNLETTAQASFQLLNQIEERKFEDIRQYRLYQHAILESKHGAVEHHDIDFILKEDTEYEPGDNLYLLDDEEWKNDQLYRASEKIVEEIKTYQAMMKALKPEEEGEIDKPLEERDEHEKSFNGKNRHAESYETLERNLKLIANGFSKLPDQSNMPYTEPFEQLDDYSLI